MDERHVQVLFYHPAPGREYVQTGTRRGREPPEFPGYGIQIDHVLQHRF